MVSKAAKADLVKSFGKSEKNTGASAVQIAILTAEIEELKEHFKNNPKDLHSKRGFMAKIEKRRRLLAYVKKVDFSTYQDTITKLKLRK